MEISFFLQFIYHPAVAFVPLRSMEGERREDTMLQRSFGTGEDVQSRIRRYAGTVYRLAYAKTGNRQDAADVLLSPAPTGGMVRL